MVIAKRLLIPQTIWLLYVIIYRRFYPRQRIIMIPQQIYRQQQPATSTGAQYSHSPTTTTQVPVYTTTPSQNLRGYSPHPSVQSTTSTSELVTTTAVYPETSNKTDLSLIYTKPQKVETEESLTGLWITLGALGFFGILLVAGMKNKQGKLSTDKVVLYRRISHPLTGV